MTSHHGRPCWFELGTTDLDAAAAFYGARPQPCGARRSYAAIERHLTPHESEPAGGESWITGRFSLAACAALPALFYVRASCISLRMTRISPLISSGWSPAPLLPAC